MRLEEGFGLMTEKEQFAQMASHVRTTAETLLTEWFGERCDDFDADCLCCQRWAALDVLLRNPFEDGEQ